ADRLGELADPEARLGRRVPEPLGPWRVRLDVVVHRRASRAPDAEASERRGRLEPKLVEDRPRGDRDDFRVAGREYRHEVVGPLAGHDRERIAHPVLLYRWANKRPLVGAVLPLTTCREGNETFFYATAASPAASRR